ncbi:hypothetical protein SAMN05428963_105130 [Consotaella salsifontis]|uniref:Uncharacterized protein n=2 Tax=Consotaella salsifontis TaxID=1365950 RepID=A0A1T4QM67_9HYPH|nr:hypothetical protein SAMN05428963_105130 [Consotaella salsifontis]
MNCIKYAAAGAIILGMSSVASVASAQTSSTAYTLKPVVSNEMMTNNKAELSATADTAEASPEAVAKQIEAHPGLAEAFAEQGVDTSTIVSLSVSPENIVTYVTK